MMEPVVGRLDIVLYKGAKSTKLRIGQVEKVSQNYKERLQDGKNHDICTEPIYSWIYPKFVTNEEMIKVKASEVKVCSRHLRIGEMVKAEDKIGYVLSVYQKPTIKFLGHNSIAHKVDPNKLVDPWMSYVIPKRPILYKGWIGKIGPNVNRRVIFEVDNLHRFSSDWEHLSLFCLQEGLVSKPQCSFEINGFSFYPGRCFFVSKENLIQKLNDGTFTSMDKFPDVSTFNGVVPIEIIRTELCPFNVHWLVNLSGRKQVQPPDKLFAEDLPKITWIRDYNPLSLGDIRMFNFNSKDQTNVYHIHQWNEYLKNRYWVKDSSRHSMKSLRNINCTKFPVKMLNYNCQDIPVEVIYLTTQVEIGWINGTSETLDSRLLLPIKPKSFPIGAFVQNIEEEDADWRDVYGVIQSVTLNVHKRDTALVKWIKKSSNDFGFRDNTTITNQVPLSILRKHSHYDFVSETKQNVVVTSIPTSKSEAILTGYVISTFPDGKLRIRETNGKLYSAWPDEVVRITPKI